MLPRFACCAALLMGLAACSTPWEGSRATPDPSGLPVSLGPARSIGSPDSADSLRAPGVQIESPSPPAPAQRPGSRPVRTLPPPQIGVDLGLAVRDDDAALTLGASYEVWVRTDLRAGGLAQYTAGPIDTLLLAPAAWYQVTDSLTLLGAPGLEWENGDGVQPALRLGVDYAATLGGAAITPFFSWTTVNGRQASVAFGVGIGTGPF